MESIRAFEMGERTRDNEAMVFDWHKAARLIKEREPAIVRAGLRDDWEWTGGDIYRNGKPVKKDAAYTYLSSTWATPEIDIDDCVEECFIMGSETEWNAETCWPESALEILNDE